MTKEQKREYEREYEKQNVRRILLKFVKTTDADILRHLEAKDNMQGYIKQLIRKDIKKEA